jgi:hypothetical protein
MSLKPSLVTANVWKQLAVKLLPFSTPSAHRNILNNYVIAGLFVRKTAHTEILQFKFLKFAIDCEFAKSFQNKKKHCLSCSL